jgi:hypothetical protein
VLGGAADCGEPPLAHPHSPSSPDGRNVAFGRVLTGLDVVVRATGTFAVNLKPATPIVIRAAGALPQGEWAAVDKAVAAEAAKLAAAQQGAGAAVGKGKQQKQQQGAKAAAGA